MIGTPASSKVGNYIFSGLLIGGGYFLWVFFPPYWDNMEMKQLARSYASAARDGRTEALARKEFIRQATNLLGQPFDDQNFDFDRVDQDSAKVTVKYDREAKYHFTDTIKVLHYKWTVVNKFNQY